MSGIPSLRKRLATIRSSEIPLRTITGWRSTFSNRFNDFRCLSRFKLKTPYPRAVSQIMHFVFRSLPDWNNRSWWFLRFADHRGSLHPTIHA